MVSSSSGSTGSISPASSSKKSSFKLRRDRCNLNVFRNDAYLAEYNEHLYPFKSRNISFASFASLFVALYARVAANANPRC